MLGCNTWSAPLPSVLRGLSRRLYRYRREKEEAKARGREPKVALGRPSEGTVHLKPVRGPSGTC